MSQAKPRRTYPFDARSVMLFTVIAVGGMTAQAQSPASAASSKTTASSTRAQGLQTQGATKAAVASQRAVFGGVSARAPATATAVAKAHTAKTGGSQP